MGRDDPGTDNRQPVDALLDLAPLRVPGIDTSRFRFDPLTDAIVALVDDQTTVRQMAEKTGKSVEEVAQRLKILEQGGLIRWKPQAASAPPVTEPPKIAAPAVRYTVTLQPSSPGTTGERGFSSAPPSARTTLSPESDVESPEVPPSEASGDFIDVIPVPVSNIDTSIFRFDDLTNRMVEMIDRVTSVKKIIEVTGADATEVVQRLKVLKDGGLITWSAAREPQTRLTLAVESPLDSVPPAEDHVRVTLPGIIHQALRAAPPPQPDEQPATEKATRPAAPATGPLESSSGSVRQKDPETLVQEAMDALFSGSIRFENRGEAIEFHFDNGIAKGVAASAERHDEGIMLGNAGKITPKMLDLYRMAMSEEKDPVHALRKAGVPDRVSMAKLISWRGKKLFEEVLTWSNATYTVTKDAPFPPEIARCRLVLVDPRDAASQNKAAWAKNDLTEEENRFISESVAKFITATEKMPFVASNMQLNEKERLYVQHVMEGCPMDIHRALAIAPFFKAKARKIIHYLLKNQALQLHETNPEGDAPVPLEELGPISKRMVVSNHFEVLCVHAVSLKEEIEARYETQLRKFDPKRYENAGEEEIAHLAAIRKRLDKAWEVLGSEESRREYRLTVYSEYQIDNFYKLQLEKAEAAIHMRNNPKEALPCALSAWDLKPGALAAGTVIITCLKALGRSNEAFKYAQRVPAALAGKKN